MSTALQQNALDRNNLLNMPSATVQPGQNIIVTFRFGGPIFGAPLADRDFSVRAVQEALDAAPDFFRVGDVSLSGSAISAMIKVNHSAVARTAEGLFSTVREFRKGIITFELMQAVPAVLGSEAGAFSAVDAAGINAQAPQFRPPVARVVTSVLAVPAAAANAAGNVLGQVKWILVLVVVLAGGYFLFPYLKKRS